MTQDERLRGAVALYAHDILPLARQNVSVVRQTYELGRGTVADVLGEQRRYLDIERAYTDALKQAYDARTSLLSARECSHDRHRVTATSGSRRSRCGRARRRRRNLPGAEPTECISAPAGGTVIARRRQ